MYVDLSEEHLKTMISQGWKLVKRAGRKYLVSPEGTKLEVEEDRLINLYVIRAVNTTKFKIGFSKNTVRRITSLQTASPFKLQIINQVGIDAPEVEKKAHDIMLRWHSHGEWFDLGEHADYFSGAVRRATTAEELLRALDTVASVL